MKIGDKYLCKESVKNIFGITLFESGLVYQILDFDENEVTLDHNLIANEYMSYKKSILDKFTLMNMFSDENITIVKSFEKKFPNDSDLGKEIRRSFRQDLYVESMPNDKELGAGVRKILRKIEK
jgi:hypothetical protein